MPKRTAPSKPKKHRAAEPMQFRETLAPNIPLVPTTRGLTARQMRIILILIWAVVVVLFGIGLGLLIVSNRLGDVGTAVESGPVTTTNIAVAASASTSQVTPSQPAARPAPAIPLVAATSITQASSGLPVETISADTYQPALSSVVLYPGYSSMVSLPQGTQGTAAVR